MSINPRLEGAPNFRDIGGHVTTDGRRIKQSRVFRSGELSRLTDADHDTLRQLGIAFVADLRSLGENELNRTRWPEGMATGRYCADITVDLRVNGRSLIDLLKEDPTPRGAARIMDHTFRVLPDLCGPALKLVAQRLAASDEPLLFHCTNGRDRTGVVSALLLYLLGATEDAILADFMTTNERIDIALAVENSRNYLSKLAGVEIDAETINLCTCVQPQYIAATFNFLDQQYGSPEAYLHAFGIDAALREKLRERLTEPG